MRNKIYQLRKKKFDGVKKKDLLILQIEVFPHLKTKNIKFMIEYENLKALNQSFFKEYSTEFETTLNSGWYILGERVKTFEAEFANYINSNHVTGVASGLDALTLALKAFDFDKNSEVIVPSNTYIATILSILHAGLKPVLVEPDISTYNINPSLIEASISPLTKAIMVVHLYGKPCFMEPILDICKQNNLKLIEDCAQSHGATFRGKTTGTFGDFGAFSFYPTKNLGALGDAGAIATQSELLNDKIKTLRNYGSKIKYHNDVVGYNSRLDEIQAAFLSVKLKYLDKITEHKRKLANIYHENLKSDFIKPFRDADYADVFHIYNIRHPKRNDLQKYLLSNEIKTEIHYPISPNLQLALKDVIETKPYPISEEIHSTTLSLPISYCHTEDDIYRVVEVLNLF